MGMIRGCASAWMAAPTSTTRLRHSGRSWKSSVGTVTISRSKKPTSSRSNGIDSRRVHRTTAAALDLPTPNAPLSQTITASRLHTASFDWLVVRPWRVTDVVLATPTAPSGAVIASKGRGGRSKRSLLAGAHAAGPVEGADLPEVEERVSPSGGDQICGGCLSRSTSRSGRGARCITHTYRVGLHRRARSRLTTKAQARKSLWPGLSGWSG